MAVRTWFTCLITAQPIDKASTEWNSRAREPVHQVARLETVQFRAQVHFTSKGRPETTSAGVSEKTSGHLVVTQRELDRRGYVPARGDKITNIPGRAGVYYLTSITPKAHKQGRNNTLHLSFEDRQPVKQ